MTKTLTEQWREGTLEQRYYYVKYFPTVGKPFVEIELKNFLLDLAKVKDRDKIEVLSPVPSYDEYNESVQKIHILNEQNTKQYNELCEEIKKNNILEKKLAIATKALKKYMTFCRHPAEQALKEMEGVK